MNMYQNGVKYASTKDPFWYVSLIMAFKQEQKIK